MDQINETKQVEYLHISKGRRSLMVKGVIRNAEIKERHSLEVKRSHNKSYLRIEGRIRKQGEPRGLMT